MVNGAREDLLRAYSLPRRWWSKGIFTALIVIAAVAFSLASIGSGGRWFGGSERSPAHARVPQLDRCEACHRPFETISDDACRACHRVNAHFATSTACIDCHPAHRNEASRVMPSRRCIDSCHEGIGFGPDHPRFTPRGGTRFDHAKHREMGETECASCHELRDGEPVTVSFAGRCGGCHAAEELPSGPRERSFAAAVFRHAPHVARGCDSCHPGASDPRQELMPRRELCEPCHAARDGVGASACVECHRFHT